MTVRATQRWAPTKAALARQRLLLAIADGERYRFSGSISADPVRYQAVIDLGRRGLITVDRSAGYTIQIVFPEERWLVALERWFEYELHKADR